MEEVITGVGEGVPLSPVFKTINRCSMDDLDGGRSFKDWRTMCEEIRTIKDLAKQASQRAMRPESFSHKLSYRQGLSVTTKFLCIV